MSSTLVRRRLGGGLLSQLLEDPQLAPALRALPAPALRQVILRVGLEDAGELIALSTLDQLREVFDEDLWRSAGPGQDEAFDAARFIVWLEVLLEAGDAFVADRLAEMPEDFLVFAVSKLVRVLDTAVLAAWTSDPRDGDLLEKVLDAQLGHEFDDHLLVSRSEFGWDAVLTTLLALDERHPQLLRGILSRCAIATHEQLEGVAEFCAALSGDELLLEDARGEREARRAERGYVSPADGRAFLALARTAPETPAQDPITRAHFRERKPAVTAAPSAPPAGTLGGPPPLRRLLAEAGAELDAQLEPIAADSLFRQALAELLESDPDAHQRVIEEMAYLANVLIAGDTSAAAPWRPLEAAEHVLELCDEGLRSLVEWNASDPAAPQQVLLRWGAVGVFRVAWASRNRPD
jgi:hypothetical protein